jgi:hypothetical protein
VPAAERARLVAAGERAAADFLAGWDVAAYLRECRGVPEPTAAPVSSGPPAPPR